jgi:hypothetical protein
MEERSCLILVERWDAGPRLELTPSAPGLAALIRQRWPALEVYEDTGGALTVVCPEELPAGLPPLLLGPPAPLVLSRSPGDGRTCWISLHCPDGWQLSPAGVEALASACRGAALDQPGLTTAAANAGGAFALVPVGQAEALERRLGAVYAEHLERVEQTPTSDQPRACGWFKRPTRGGRWRVVVSGTEDDCWKYLLAMREPGDKAVLPAGRRP